ncbi:cell division protein ZapA [Plasticicumulans sp.]|uniref:cell division protein ZapA n=1 Tax=Plasticicumulans sp. TaxID=2307179 RepID=UPI000F99F867|nr:cell division protein ZapA [Plasticicumulans sp.]MBS0603288.1 cell division protein ZapA [Pseudomonadota bacterium]RTL01046.1 MAG: cell division protein ZapA [Xanthomonadales bacterium]HMV37970.1 cell division protein ZapA [Plasticicumulans sp.]HMW29496.1 cell division protein ZapA [Plasticicumulans sp.]HMW42170.1 cell division protein ZapA [Plasticicumulans sp.]
MSENAQLVSVHIMDADYKVSCPPADLPELQQAAAFLNARIAEIRASGRVSGSERIIAIASLNLAYDYLQLLRETSADRDEVRQRAEKLLSQVESALGKITETPL